MKKTVTLNDKTFEVMIPAHEIDREHFHKQRKGEKVYIIK